MFRNRAALILVSTLVGLYAPLAARAQDDAEVRRELEARYAQLAEAHDRRDLPAIFAMKTADFHGIFPDGRIGDSKTMEEYSRQFLENNKPPYNMRFTIQKLTVSQNRLIAVVEVLQEVSRQRELLGRLRRVDTSVVQRETWAKIDGVWKLKVADNVRDQKRFIDGKRVDPTKPYDPTAPPYVPEADKQPTRETKRVRAATPKRRGH